MSESGAQPKPPEGPRPGSSFATVCGWLGLVVCLIACPFCIPSPWGRRVSVDAWEMRAYERAARGIVGAVAIGLGIRAYRVGRHPMVGAAAITIGALFVLFALISLIAPDNLKVGYTYW